MEKRGKQEIGGKEGSMKIDKKRKAGKRKIIEKQEIGVKKGNWYKEGNQKFKKKRKNGQNGKRMFIPHYVSCVMCHMPRVTCHVSRSPVTCNFFYKFFY